jgi:hypothetical protein
MEVTRLYCPTCDTAIEGHFDICKFCQLSDEMRDFTEIFLRSRGNIKEVERALGISYPTVRGRLDAVIRALGYSVEPGPSEDERAGEKRRDVLDALSKGEITAQDAINRLRQA